MSEPSPNVPLINVRATGFSIEPAGTAPDGSPFFMLVLTNGLVNMTAALGLPDVKVLEARASELAAPVGPNGKRLTVARDVPR